MTPGHFVHEYLHACGTSEVPKRFHRWTALSILASALADRVYMRKGASRVRPNLFVFLLGPSGCGKGEAISTGLRLVRDLPQIATEYGRVTAAALVDRLATKAGTAGDRAKLLLVTPELAMAVGRGPTADDLIKLMTELYTGGEVPLIERTRTSGRHVIRGHCLNWLAGTTREWLRDCVTREAVEGGFFARVACVQAAYADTRQYVPAVPPDADETWDRCRVHLAHLLTVQGEIVYDPRADDLHREWYLNRPEPVQEILLPSWRREDDFVRKLAMLLALAEPDPQPIILPAHEAEAQMLAADTARHLPAIIDFIGAGLESDLMRRVRHLLHATQTIHHSVLANQLSRQGVTSDKLRLCIDTLVESGLVRRDRHPRGGWLYVWNTRRASVGDDE